MTRRLADAQRLMHAALISCANAAYALQRWKTLADEETAARMQRQATEDIEKVLSLLALLVQTDKY